MKNKQSSLLSVGRSIKSRALSLLKSFYKYILNNISFTFLILILLSGFILIALGHKEELNKSLNSIFSDPVEYSIVKIVSVSSIEKGGGTGFVIKSNLSGSLVITNSHVCRALTKKNELAVVDYKQRVLLPKKITEDSFHDLCAIETATKISNGLSVANSPSKDFEKIKVMGFPLLYGPVISEGYISKKAIIQIIVGFEKCTQEELESFSKNGKIENIVMCLVWGKPIIKEYEAALISAPVAPGNSGSPILNSRGEVVGVVFATVNNASVPSFGVPLEYLLDFIKKVL